MRKQFGHINGFQDTVLTPTFDDKSQTWTQQDNSFQPQPLPSAQIHYIQDIHTGQYHFKSWTMTNLCFRQSIQLSYIIIQ